MSAALNKSELLKRLGARLRQESADIVETKLPPRLRVLAEQLARLDQEGKGRSSGEANVSRGR